MNESESIDSFFFKKSSKVKNISYSHILLYTYIIYSIQRNDNWRFIYILIGWNI
jgi:hypothetical protein